MWEEKKVKMKRDEFFGVVAERDQLNRSRFLNFPPLGSRYHDNHSRTGAAARRRRVLCYKSVFEALIKRGNVVQVGSATLFRHVRGLFYALFLREDYSTCSSWLVDKSAQTRTVRGLKRAQPYGDRIVIVRDITVTRPLVALTPLRLPALFWFFDIFF